MAKYGSSTPRAPVVPAGVYLNKENAGNNQKLNLFELIWLFPQVWHKWKLLACEQALYLGLT